MSPRLIIKTHHPWRHRVKIALAMAGLMAMAWGIFQYGHSRAGLDNESLYEERELLREQIRLGKDSNQKLRGRIAVLERTAQVDKGAYGEVEKSLKQTQDEMLELKEEVAFYRGIVSPAEAASGLSIGSFKVTEIGGERVYRFKLVLTQLKSNKRIVKGYARVVFEGVKNGSQQKLSLKEVSGGKMDKLKLRFKYFQDNEGEIVLPEGFLPSRVLIEVVPSGKRATRLKKTFDWLDVLD